MTEVAFKIDPVQYAEEALAEAARQLHGRYDQLWFYRGANGVPLYGKIRRDLPDGTKYMRPVSIDEDGVYQRSEPSFEGGKPLYNLHLLMAHKAAPVWVVEGEKCADRLNAFLADQNAVGIATTSGGSSSAAKADWSPLNGRVVTVWPDNDAAGTRYCGAVANVLKARAAQVHTIDAAMLDLDPGGDVFDYLEAHPDITYEQMMDELPIKQVSEAKETPGDDAPPRVKKSDANRIIEMANSCCTFFHDSNGEAYAAMEVKDHREVWPIESKGFEDWIYGTFYRIHNSVPGDASYQNAKRALSGQAKFEGPLVEVHTRVAKHDGYYWIDLANDTWQAVKVSADGWEVVDKPPVYFMRGQSMRPLPVPDKDGDISKLWEVVNIQPNDRLMALAWMLECFRPECPYPVLELVGTQGSAKSTTQRYLREFIDPNKSNLRAAPKNVQDIFVAARNAHLVSLENLSHLSRDYQDALCTLATGGGYAGRTLYSDSEETVYDIKKPIMVNGIAVVVTAQDLSDRTVHFDLPEILEGRRTDVEVGALFQEHRAQIFGGVLDAFAAALEVLPEVKAEGRRLPRMADFALLGEAVFRSHGKPAGAFIDLYNQARVESVHRTLEGSPVAMALQSYMDDHPGTNRMLIKHWFNALEQHKPPYTDKNWPKSPRGFSDAIRRVMPALRLIGIEVSFPEKRTKDGNLMEVKLS